MAFVPPQFSKLGKGVKDLLKKKYDFRTEAKTVNKASQGVTLEAGFHDVEDLNMYVKVTHKDASFGEVEVRADTTGDATAQLKLKKLSPGVEVIANGAGSGATSLEATYAQEFFALSAKACTDFESYHVNASGTIGHDGLSVGGSVCADVSSGMPDLSDYNVGVQWAQSDFTTALVTSKQTETITASYLQKLSSTFTLGSSVTLVPEKGSRVLTVGGEYGIDDDTTFKAKATSTGCVCAAVETVLKDPNVKFGFAAAFDATNDFSTKDFGVSITAGDF